MLFSKQKSKRGEKAAEPRTGACLNSLGFPIPSVNAHFGVASWEFCPITQIWPFLPTPHPDVFNWSMTALTRTQTNPGVLDNPMGCKSHMSLCRSCCSCCNAFSLRVFSSKLELQEHTEEEEV